jgi:RimJ/RimL family protein N-acetyltransferase
MNPTYLETPRLRLMLRTRDETRAEIAQMKPDEKAAVSPAWLALLEGSSQADLWIHGFTLIDRANSRSVGQCGFKGPPGTEGVVEISYGIAPEHQGKGYATEAAAALTDYAFRQREVRAIRAHTLPETNASARVLTKCGFRCVGEAIDPEDGLVWRWEKS